MGEQQCPGGTVICNGAVITLLSHNFLITFSCFFVCNKTQTTDRTCLTTAVVTMFIDCQLTH